MVDSAIRVSLTARVDGTVDAAGAAVSRLLSSSAHVMGDPAP
jgi:hypothetical protein